MWQWHVSRAEGRWRTEVETNNCVQHSPSDPHLFVWNGGAQGQGRSLLHACRRDPLFAPGCTLNQYHHHTAPFFFLSSSTLLTIAHSLFEHSFLQQASTCCTQSTFSLLSHLHSLRLLIPLPHSSPPPLLHSLRFPAKAMETGSPPPHGAAGSAVQGSTVVVPDGCDPTTSSPYSSPVMVPDSAVVDHDRSSHTWLSQSSPPPSPSFPQSHYLITTPYPLVQSSPSLIDSVRSSVYSASLPLSASPRSFNSLPVYSSTSTQHSPEQSPVISSAVSFAAPPPPQHWSSLKLAPKNNKNGGQSIMSAYPTTSPLPLSSTSSSSPSAESSHEMQGLYHPSFSLSMPIPPPPPLSPITRDDDDDNGDNGIIVQQGQQVLSTTRTMTDNVEGQQGNQDQDRDQDQTPSSRPRSVMDVAIDSSGISEAGRTVRRNALDRVTWSNIPRNARAFLVLNGIMTVLKVMIKQRVSRESERGEHGVRWAPTRPQ